MREVEVGTVVLRYVSGRIANACSENKGYRVSIGMGEMVGIVGKVIRLVEVT